MLLSMRLGAISSQLETPDVIAQIGANHDPGGGQIIQVPKNRGMVEPRLLEFRGHFSVCQRAFRAGKRSVDGNSCPRAPQPERMKQRLERLRLLFSHELMICNPSG